MTRRATLPPEAASVGAARRLVRDTFTSWALEELEEECVLLVSELVTNAVLHARTPVDVTITRLDDGTVRVEVADRNPRHPMVKHYGADAATGRGLVLVDRLSTRWGVDGREGGKVVWFEIAVGGAGRSRSDEHVVGLGDVDLDEFDAIDAGLDGDDLRRSPDARCERAA